MSDDYGYMISCPFCGSEDVCKHLVASFDHENAAIGGGLFSTREEELRSVVRSGFDAVLAAHGESVAWNQGQEFAEAWDDFVDRRNDGDEDPLDSGMLARLLDTLLQTTKAESDGRADLTAFYSRRPQAIYEQVVANFHKACAAVRAKT